MKKHRKTWSPEDKLQIVQASNDRGISEASTEFGVSTTMIYKWRSDIGQSPNVNQEIVLLRQQLKMLERENRNYRSVVADQTLALKIKDDIIKKKILKERL